MDPTVPLVVPEVNASDLSEHQGIVSIPNCTTTPLVMTLKPLHEKNPVKRVIVDTYQSVSGTGAAAINELLTQSGNVMSEKQIETDQYPHQIAFNVLPHVEPFTQNNYTNEEMKLVNETRKILHAPEIQISATCVRVPVLVSHSEAVHIEFSKPIDPTDVRTILSEFPGITVMDDPLSDVYPMAINAEGQDDVFVGRIRRDISHPNGIALWIASDNLRKGAGLNAIQIAEELLKQNLLLASNRRV
jgi:aspartate-semialdehyde dehydrogenase